MTDTVLLTLTGEPVAGEVAYRMWQEYGEAIGQEALRAAYGDYWPRRQVYREEIFVFRQAQERIAWCSLRPDPVDPLVWFTAGVWPAWQDRAVVQEVRAWAINLALQWWPQATGLAMEILDTNLAYAVSMRARIEKGTVPWRAAGRIDIPGHGASLFWLPLGEA